MVHVRERWPVVKAYRHPFGAIRVNERHVEVEDSRFLSGRGTNDYDVRDRHAQMVGLLLQLPIHDNSGSLWKRVNLPTRRIRSTENMSHENLRHILGRHVRIELMVVVQRLEVTS